MFYQLLPPLRAISTSMFGHQRTNIWGMVDGKRTRVVLHIRWTNNIIEWADDGIVKSKKTAQIGRGIIAIKPRNREARDGVMRIHIWCISIDHAGYNYNLHINPRVQSLIYLARP